MLEDSWKVVEDICKYVEDPLTLPGTFGELARMSKPTPYREFGILLTEGIQHLQRAWQYKHLGPTQRELAKRLGYGDSTLHSWRRGEHLPDDPIIAKLARIFVQEWGANQEWIRNFLEKGGYGGSPETRGNVIHELFGGDGGIPDPPPTPDDNGGDVPGTQTLLIAFTVLLFFSLIIALIFGDKISSLVTAIAITNATLTLTPSSTNTPSITLERSLTIA